MRMIFLCVFVRGRTLTFYHHSNVFQDQYINLIKNDLHLEHPPVYRNRTVNKVRQEVGTPLPQETAREPCLSCLPRCEPIHGKLSGQMCCFVALKNPKHHDSLRGLSAPRVHALSTLSPLTQTPEIQIPQHTPRLRPQDGHSSLWKTRGLVFGGYLVIFSRSLCPKWLTVDSNVLVRLLAEDCLGAYLE